MICLPNSYVLWEPKRSADITVESLLLLELVIPKIGVNTRNGVRYFVLTVIERESEKATYAQYSFTQFAKVLLCCGGKRGL